MAPFSRRRRVMPSSSSSAALLAAFVVVVSAFDAFPPPTATTNRGAGMWGPREHTRGGLWRRCPSIPTPAMGTRASTYARGISVGSGKTTTTTTMDMVRNVDLPEAIVFYGLETVLEEEDVGGADDDDDDTQKSEFAPRLVIRAGVVRLLSECRELGTAALVLSERHSLRAMRSAIGAAARTGGENGGAGDGGLPDFGESGGVARFRSCRDPDPDGGEERSRSPDAGVDAQDEDEEWTLYDLGFDGRSPSPAFLLDSLRSVKVEPRAFGGSSGFGRMQWTEPGRSPMPARTVVFVSADRGFGFDIDRGVEENGDGNRDSGVASTVRDRCAAARAAGCRVLCLESADQSGTAAAERDAMDMSDGVLASIGEPDVDYDVATLDALSTPGDYWLNPPSPRDDAGNGADPDDVAERFRARRRSSREEGNTAKGRIATNAIPTLGGDGGEVAAGVDDGEDDKMKEDEMERILADLGGL